jgi:glycosyltransferase involved in cell wall biosynthesis
LWGYAQSLEADVRVRGAVYLLAPLVALALRRALGERLLARRYDCVHVHWLVPNAVPVAQLVRAQQTPLVVSLHGSDVFVAERSRLLGALSRAALEAAGSVSACSSELHARALRLGAPAARTRTVPYGVDVAAFGGNRAGTELRARFGVAAGTLLVVAVGRLVEKKGFAHLVDAAAQCAGLHVVLVGEGDLRGALETRARERRAPVSFAGPLDRAGVAAALAEADVVAVPSVVDRAGNVDGLPNTLLEGLAAGRAVLASRVAGIPDVVEDGHDGLLVPPGDVAALAAALARLAREPETRARLGRRARETAVARLSWDAAARAFEECYAQAAALDAR